MKQCIHVAIFDCKNGYKQSQKSLPVTFVSLYYEIPLQSLHMSSGLEIRSPSLLILKELLSKSKRINWSYASVLANYGYYMMTMVDVGAILIVLVNVDPFHHSLVAKK